MTDDTYPAPPDGWICFHCGERFRSVNAARDHFGERPSHVPACQITTRDLRDYRRLEAQYGVLNARNRKVYKLPE